MPLFFSKGFNNKKPPVKYEELPVEVAPSITLDEEQKAVVYSTAENIAVIAGAGSGKTRVLTERIKYLVEDLGVKPCDIISITFTNEAADEMKERLCNVKNIGDAFIGTIHAFANRIMKESGESYKIFNDDIDVQYHRELIEKYCKHLTVDKYLEYKDLTTQILLGKIDENATFNFFLPSELDEYNRLHLSYETVQEDLKNKTHISFGESIKTLCKERGVITFDELLIKAKAYFEKQGITTDYVFVDEFQDIGELEYKFITSLKANHYFFVGDDWQSIYRFKGGNVHLFTALLNNKNFRTYYLVNNYRNGTDIISCANIVINQATGIIQKNINPVNTHTGSVTVFSKFVVDDVLKKIKFDYRANKDNYRDWFLLVRTNKDLYTMTEKCEKLGIPYITFRREGKTHSEIEGLKKLNCIKILTVHTSKGLESKNVILYGKFPIYVKGYLTNSDERKVMYVGVTRAKDNLIILN